MTGKYNFVSIDDVTLEEILKMTDEEYSEYCFARDIYDRERIW